jgi:hypothetical protein
MSANLEQKMKKSILLMSLMFATSTFAAEKKGPTASKIKLTRELFLQKVQQLSDEEFLKLIAESTCGTACPYFIKSIVYKADLMMKARELATSRVAVEMAETLVTYFFDTVRGKDARDLARELENLSADSAQLFQEFNQSLAERDQRQLATLAVQAKKDVECEHQQEIAEISALSDEFQKRLALSQQALDRWIEKYNHLEIELRALKGESVVNQPVEVSFEPALESVAVVSEVEKEQVKIDEPKNPGPSYGKIGLTVGVSCAFVAAVSSALYFLVKMLQRVKVAHVLAVARHGDVVAQTGEQAADSGNACEDCGSMNQEQSGEKS